MIFPPPLVDQFPDTQHLSLAGIAELAREEMAKGRMAFRYFEPGQRRPVWDDAGERPTPRTMTIFRAAGLAPYVGRPFVYMWDVATTDDGRWVAGPSRIEYLPDPPPFPFLGA